MSTPRRGQAALSIVFLIGGIVFVAGISISLFAFSFLNAGFGFEAVQRITAANAAGISDALMRLDRSKIFSSAGYTIPVGEDTVTVTVTQGQPATNQATITAQTSLRFRSRTTQAVVQVHPTTGQLTLLSIQ